jgi:tetratricopeptide (TPR) repeat protein
MRKTLLTFFSQGLLLFFLLLFSSTPGVASERCKNPVARLVSLQGSAQHQSSEQSAWQKSELNTVFCPGDTFRVSVNSRAALVLTNETLLRLKQKSTISFKNSSKAKFSILELLRGSLHIFSHRPRSLKVVTPYVNGVVEGTEFLVQVSTDQAVISVFEGKVMAENQYGKLPLSSRQSALATQTTAPKYQQLVKTLEGVDWALYYPEIVFTTDPVKTNTQWAAISKITDLLKTGNITEAEQSLSKLLTKHPQNSNGLALASIIETVKNNNDQAMLLAQQALTSTPDSASAHLALSYVQQAQFDIPAALATLTTAARLHPENSLILARQAELMLATGNSAGALDTANKATVTPTPSGLSHTVLGFVYLSRTQTTKALSAFKTALTLDSALPLARLGMGLAKIRQGKLKEGRAEIEISAALDPGNALIRSYLGKTYFDEKRNNLSQRQYEIAQELDPEDPTPWFYDALQLQSENKPVEALHDLQKSITLNDNRAVYRSRLLLDDDLAARSASLGRVYTDLGFEQLAQVEAWKSVSSSPTNYSAHRLLSDTYKGNSRNEISRVSSLLKSMLLQPLNVTPIQPRLAESDRNVSLDSGPSSPSFNEFHPLFLRDRITFLASGIAGSNDTQGTEAVLAGVKGRFSFSLGQYHYQSDGIRANNDQEHDIYNAFVQMMISPDTSVMAELRYRDKNSGDLVMKFDPDSFSDLIRYDDRTTSGRIGLRHNITANSTILGTAIISSDDNDANIAGGNFISSYKFDTSKENAMAEIQHIYHKESFNLQTGAGFMSADENTKITFSPPIDPDADETKTEHGNIYSYAQIHCPFNTTTTLGLTYDMLNSPVKDRDDLNPKLGLTWQISNNSLFRAAVFRTVTRNILYSQTLEPTFLAGFDQFPGNQETSAAWNYGLGFDHSFSSNLHGGLEFLHRKFDVYESDLLTNTIIEDDQKEDLLSAYFYWAPTTFMTLSLEYFFESISRDTLFDLQDIFELKSHQLSPSLRLFSDSGLSAEIKAHFVDQEGEFYSFIDDKIDDDDNFMVVDLSASYRLPKRYGIIKIEITNLFDEDFKFVDIQSATPRFQPEQQIMASVTLSF